MCANELLRDAVGGAKVPGRVEGQSGHDGAAVFIMASGGVGAANGEESPARGVAGVSDAVGGGLQEVEEVDRGAGDGAAQNDEELEDDAAGKQDEGRKSEEGASRTGHGEGR